MTHPKDTTPANPAQVTDALEALKPFTTFAENNVERADGGWQWTGCSKNRICDWFGPSDFGLLLHFAPALTAAIGAGGQAVALREAENALKAALPIVASSERESAGNRLQVMEAALATISDTIAHPVQPGWQSQCATEDCCKPASVHFIRGGIGSYYCHDCYRKVQALSVAPQPKGE